MKRLIAVLILAAVALVPASASAKSKTKVYRGTFTLVGGDGDYVTGNFGKAQLVDGKRNDKLSVHVRRLAKRTTYTYRLQQGSCKEGAPGGTDVAGWKYRTLKTNRKGVGNSTARSRTFTARRDAKYFVGVYSATGEIVACAQLRTKGKKPHGKPHKPQRQAARQGRQAARHERRQAARRATTRPAARARTPRSRPRTRPAARATTRRAARAATSTTASKTYAGPPPRGRAGWALGQDAPDRARARAAPGPSAAVGGVEPALQRRVPDQRDLAVGVDPVAHAQLAHQPERVARARAATVGREGAGAGLDRPAAGVQRGQRAALVVGRRVERVRAGAAQRVRP